MIYSGGQAYKILQKAAAFPCTVGKQKLPQKDSRSHTKTSTSTGFWEQGTL